MRLEKKQEKRINDAVFTAEITELHRGWAWDCFPQCASVSFVVEASRSLIAGALRTKEVACIEAMLWEVCYALPI